MSNCNCSSCVLRREEADGRSLEVVEAKLRAAVSALQEIERLASRADPDNVSKTWQDIAALAFRGQP